MSKVKKYILCALFLMLCSRCAGLYAETEITVSIKQSAEISVMGSFFNPGEIPEKKITMLFREDAILIKSAKQDIAFDFNNRVVIWRNQSSENVRSMQDQEASFDTIFSRGAGAFSFLAEPGDLYTKGRVKDVKKNIITEGYALKEYRWKVKQPPVKMNMRIWALENSAQSREIVFALKRLITECGAFPNIEGFDIWANTVLAVSQIPFLIKAEGKASVMGMMGTNIQSIISIKRFNQDPGLSDKDIALLLKENKFIAMMREFFKKFSSYKMLIPTIAILLLVFSPLWWPRVWDRFYERAGAQRRAQSEERDTIRHLYNFLSFIKEHKDAPEEQFREKYEAVIEDLEKRKIIKKYFKKPETEQLEQIMRRKISGPEIDNQIDKFLQKCDELLDELV